jgi:hypothetical protein
VRAPVTCVVMDAAMTLFNAIQAKLVTNSSTASACAPPVPSAARVATIDGTRSREPTGASAAVNSAPPIAPITITLIAACNENVVGRLAPTCNVVATMLAPTKMRNRSSGALVCSSGPIGSRSTGCMVSAQP